ncbi:pyridoxal phosphate-dependent transferase [Fusarium solani]|uniref:Pyridoxal phosphate-dependent transferase n=1 Tax=Fusarium solani TaxID=169388 RepID=A0A9P9JT97_FUSSL|nr:pyridoxal phosphate-dependent transferase [Fusarium solani]KAH7232496.1 pyridoxal phosphate-dependent transferase [Fusarium solani]
MKLSGRGQATASNKGGSLLWEVTANLWDATTNPSGYVSLGMAENVLMQDELLQHIIDNTSLQPQALTYGDGTTGSKRLKLALAHFLNKYLNPHKKIDLSHITITNGCSAAIEHIAWAVGDGGDGFLITKPFFRAFIPTFGLRVDTEVIQVPCHDVDPFCEDVVEKYEARLQEAKAQGKKIAGILLCNPHNPLGRCYPEGTLVRLMEFCQKHQLHLISDEVYAMSTWTNHESPTTPFTSCLSIDPTGIIDPSLIHVVWGVSKDFGSNGIRLGSIISQSNPLLHNALVPAALYSMCSSLAEHSFANVFEDDAWVDSYLAKNRAKLAEHYRLITSWATEHNIHYARGSNAGFFLWVNLGEAYCRNHPEQEHLQAEDRVMKLLLEQKVFVAPGASFGAEGSGWFRLVFSVDKTTLLEGLTRINSILE